MDAPVADPVALGRRGVAGPIALGLFFTCMRPSKIVARLGAARFLSVVCVVAATCKLPFALRLGLGGSHSMSKSQ